MRCMKKLKVALVYDRINKWGGAEKVLLTLHKMYPHAPLYTSVYNPDTARWAKAFPKIYTSFIQRIPCASNHHEWFPYLMPFAFSRFNFSKYDLVISVTSEFAKNINTTGKTKHICYCLTPTRYLWSGYDDYFKNKIVKFIATPLINYLRKVDLKAAEKPDVMIAISTEVQKRIKKYYTRNSKIIFPPVGFSRSHRKNPLSRDFVTRNSSSLDAHYFLLVSRLVSYKKVDLAVRAFNKNGHILVIVGTGSEEAKLKKMAKDNIKFVGFITERKLKTYYKNCKAIIFPQKEDFGLVAVEALSFGKPVIAYKRGGIQDIVDDGRNGVFFNKQTPESLIKAIEKFFTMQFNNAIIASTAERFAESKFRVNLKSVINKL